MSVKWWIARGSKFHTRGTLFRQPYLKFLAPRPIVRMAAAASLAVPGVSTSATTEYFDVLNEIGAKTGIVKARNHVHRDGTNTFHVVHMNVAIYDGRRVTSFCPIR